MFKIAKMITISVIIALVVSVFPVMAQMPESNTSVATAGIYGTDVDDYMSYFYYSDVAYDKWFGFTGWNKYNGLDLGYSMRPGGIHFGLLYNGTGVYQSNERTVETIDPTYSNTTGGVTSTSTTTQYQNHVFSTNNSIYALIGVAGMGIKVGFRGQTVRYDNPDNTYTEVNYNGFRSTYANQIDDYTRHYYQFNPMVGWGMGLNLGSMVIKPYVEGVVGFNSNESQLVTSDYQSAFGTVSGLAAAERKTSSASGRVGFMNDNTTPQANILPQIKAGAGLAMGRAEFGLEYNIEFDIWNNSYNVFGVSGDIKGTASWASASATRTVDYGDVFVETEDSVTVSLVERSRNAHLVIPSFYYDWDLTEQVRLGIYGEIPVGFAFETRDSYSTTTNATTHNMPTDIAQSYSSVSIQKNYAGKSDITTFQIVPRISVGAQYKMVPDRFTVNAGIGCTPVGYYRQTTEVSANGYQTTHERAVDGLGNVWQDEVTVDLNAGMTNDSVTVRSDWYSLSASVAAGFTFYFTPKFALDTVFTSQLGYDYNDVGLDAVNVLFTLKK